MNKPIRGKIRTRWYEVNGTPYVGMHADNLLPNVERVVVLPITDSGVGGLEPWMMKVLKKYAKHYDGNVKLELLPIAAAIEAILKETEDES